MPAPAKVEVTEKALADIARVVTFLHRHSPAAAKRLRDAISQALGAIGASPRIGRRWQGAEIGSEVRERVLRLGRSTYIIRYAVEENAVIILRVHHAREDR